MVHCNLKFSARTSATSSSAPPAWCGVGTRFSGLQPSAEGSSPWWSTWLSWRNPRRTGRKSDGGGGAGGRPFLCWGSSWTVRKRSSFVWGANGSTYTVDCVGKWDPRRRMRGWRAFSAKRVRAPSLSICETWEVITDKKNSFSSKVGGTIEVRAMQFPAQSVGSEPT